MGGINTICGISQPWVCKQTCRRYRSI